MPKGKAASVASGLDDESIELLLETAKDEYSNENGRIAGHDSKMNIMLPTSLAYLLAVLETGRIPDILAISVTSVLEGVLPTIALIAYLVGLVLAVVAIVRMLIVLLPKEYTAIDVEDFYNTSYLHKSSRDVFRFHLFQRYVDATRKNREQNNKRMQGHKKACICMVVSIFAVVVYNFIKAVLLKGD